MPTIEIPEIYIPEIYIPEPYSPDIPVVTYRDGIRTAYTTRKTEIDNCADTAALVTLYGSTEQSDKTWKPNMTQYPADPRD